MIRSLNYPQPLPDAIVLDLVKQFTGSPGKCLSAFEPRYCSNIQPRRPYGFARVVLQWR